MSLLSHELYHNAMLFLTCSCIFVDGGKKQNLK